MRKILYALTISLIGILLTSNCAVVDSVTKSQREREWRQQIEEQNERIEQLLQAGNEAFTAKNYDLAIEKFDEGYKASPYFPGSAPVFLNNKAQSLIQRGTATYNNSLKSDQVAKNTAQISAKNDFEQAVYSSERALEILKNADLEYLGSPKTHEANVLIAFTIRKSAHRLLAQTGADRTQGKRALDVFREYLLVETDPAKKAKAQMELALTLQDSDEFELAAAEFRKILENSPEDVDALVGIGLSLINLGYSNQDLDDGKKQLREAQNYLKKYLALAPENHKFKQDAQGAVESLAETDKPSKIDAGFGISISRRSGYLNNKAVIAEPVKEK